MAYLTQWADESVLSLRDMEFVFLVPGESVHSSRRLSFDCTANWCTGFGEGVVLLCDVRTSVQKKSAIGDSGEQDCPCLLYSPGCKPF